MINKIISNKKKNNKRLSKKNIRKSEKINLKGGLNCDIVADEETCRARAPECLWKPRGRRCVDNPNPDVNARVAAAARAPIVADRVVNPVAAAARAATNPVAAGPDVPVIYTRANRNAAVVAFAAAAVVFPPIPVVPIAYNVVRIPEVDAYNAQQDRNMRNAAIAAQLAVSRQEFEDAQELYREAERLRFGIDEPVRFNIIDNVLDAGGIPPQNIDPNLLRVFGDFNSFDIFEQDNVTIRDHLNANTDNITIFYRQNINQEFNSSVLTFTQLKTYLKESTNLFYECNAVDSWLSYRLRPPQYLKLPVNDRIIYVSYPEIRQKCINGQRMIFLEFNRQIHTTISFHVSVGSFLIRTTGEHIPSAVSANHCQVGSSIQLYNIIA